MSGIGSTRLNNLNSTTEEYYKWLNKQKQKIIENYDIEKMTIKQAKEYCMKFRKLYGYPCKETVCELRKRNICMDWVHEWRIERLTQSELDICRLIGAKYVTRDILNEFYVLLWSENPEYDGAGSYTGDPIACIGIEKFPSVKVGEIICLEDENESVGSV